MDMSRLSSFLAIVAALNIFYAMYGFIQMDWTRTLMSTFTYLALIYASAFLDRKSGEMARDREIETIRLKSSILGKETRAE